MKIGVALSLFNEPISRRLKAGALDELKNLGITDIQLAEVPGVVEIPMAAQWLFQVGCEGVIALGAVIQGETFHYEACQRMAEQGCMHVQLKENRPLIFGVLMTSSKKQAFARSGGVKGHVGKTAAQGIMKMLQLKQQLLNKKN